MEKSSQRKKEGYGRSYVERKTKSGQCCEDHAAACGEGGLRHRCLVTGTADDGKTGTKKAKSKGQDKENSKKDMSTPRTDHPQIIPTRRSRLCQGRSHGVLICRI